MFYAVLFFATLLLLFLCGGVRKPAKFPPGPKWYPIVGSALQISQMRLRCGMFCKVIDELAKRYLNPYGLYGLKIGKDKLVIAYTNDSISEMMTNEDIDGRPDGIFYRVRTFNSRLGILLTDGEMWVEQRRFIFRHLKNFGFARSGMMDIVHHEATCLLQGLREKVLAAGGGPTRIPMHDLFAIYVLNTLWCMLSGRRYERDSPEITELLEMFHELFKNIDMVGALFSHFPLLRFIAPDYSGYTAFMESHRALYAFMRKEIELHRSSYRNYDTPRDLMDSYLRAQEAGNDSKQMFSDESLLATCLDLFLAGSETTNKSLGFCFMHMVLQPEIQERAYTEIKEVVGLERIPEWSDRPKMPYCEAITMEALRMFMAHTFGIPHRAVCDTRLSGYEIPKDTMVIACFRGMLNNPVDFPEPESFDPTRFLIDGQLKLPEAFNPFGFGRHRCMGDLLGRQNLFMFTTTILQHFKLIALPGMMPEEVPLDGITAAVKPYDVLFVPRCGVKS
ncbi:probable cytochrome P450 303a1 [Scaptodrosophila lebanonensis]|uniref:Probable cytochrome P450 303a1 n=1 Tax=Drosophila lebanonensis TaxID=7225 RepID=A0A6J2U6A0_DROLE|nr:probable cytochrome P450 303a1 [Scaptodrosophila lebanonensis]